jgi:hypothetical protein
MLPQQMFHDYQVPYDFFNDYEPVLRLSDLPKKDESLPIELSVGIGFTDFRRTQLARSLESLCRQSWKNFEVLIGDNGSTQDMESIYQQFDPYLRMRVVRTPRDGFSGCPSKAWKSILPFVKGTVLSVSQPEMMMKPWACEFLYKSHYELRPNTNYYKINEPSIAAKTGSPVNVDDWKHGRTWATLKPGFLNKRITIGLDSLNWHDDISVIEYEHDYANGSAGLSNQPNSYWSVQPAVPWWFAGSARIDDPLWEDLPVKVGHATIDLWLLNYRHLFGFVDMMPVEVAGYHQDHVRGSVSPEGEQASVSTENILKDIERRKQDGR